jgi:ribosome-associated protein
LAALRPSSNKLTLAGQREGAPKRPNRERVDRKQASRTSTPRRSPPAQATKSVQKKVAQQVPSRSGGVRASNWPRPSRTETVERPLSGNEQSRKVALLAAQGGLEKKATQIEIIDVSGKVDYADFLVLMTGQSDRNVAAIANSVEDLLAKNGVKAISIEGLPAANWVLIDFVDVVVHVFQQDSRAIYDLDGLWMDARRIQVPPTAQSATS